MPITQDVFVLNDFGGSTLEERRRTTSSGTKSRYSVTIKAEPILINLDPVRLGQGPAFAIRDALRRSIKNIAAFAAESTRKRRERSAREFARGGASATRRYAGGRTGATPPNQSGRMFNDAGRLADNLEVRQTGEDGSWIVNVVANRLDPSTFTGAAYEAMVRRLMELAPVWRGGEQLLKEPDVVAAIRKGLEDSFAKVGEARGNMSKAWWRAASATYNGLLKPILLG